MIHVVEWVEYPLLFYIVRHHINIGCRYSNTTPVRVTLPAPLAVALSRDSPLASARTHSTSASHPTLRFPRKRAAHGRGHPYFFDDANGGTPDVTDEDLHKTIRLFSTYLNTLNPY